MAEILTKCVFHLYLKCFFKVGITKNVSFYLCADWLKGNDMAVFCSHFNATIIMILCKGIDILKFLVVQSVCHIPEPY